MQPFFRIDSLSVSIAIFVGLFSFLTIVYSLGFMRFKKSVLSYYLYIILTMVFSLGAVFSNHLVLFIVFWGFLGLLLYLLIIFGENNQTPATAKKAFIIVGGTDALMLLGLAFIWRITNSVEMDKLHIALNTKSAALAYLCLAAGAFAKAGAMPFHTWVPDTAQDAPAPVVAFLPASLDKLLGIYLLMRISSEIFVMNSAMNNLLLAVGSLTILAAVMMALIQHDLKRLLGYHAVSQVGYMVLGIGTGNPIGIAGGLFHMLNNAIYKSCLFFSGGGVEKRAGTTELERLGGLAKEMPVTFLTFMTASLAISGIPPLNGFVSKWMVYQGIIETAKTGGRLWIIWLLSAMFGSALTLASFMKLIHAVFLGQPDKARAKGYAGRTNWFMLIPQIALAILCVIFGIFAGSLPLRYLIFPCLKTEVIFTGVWDSAAAAMLLLGGIILGLLIYLLAGIKIRSTDTFVGGETAKDFPDMRVSGTQFYDTIKDIKFLRGVYILAEKKAFDIYEQAKNAVFAAGGFLRYLHNGVLPTYLVWTLLGMMGIFLFLHR